MATKIIAFVLTFGLNFAVGFFILSFLLVALNGFSEDEAIYAFGVFIIGGLTVSLLMALFSFFVAGWGLQKEWHPFFAAGLAVAGGTLLGFAVKFVLFFLALAAAGLARSWR